MEPREASPILALRVHVRFSTLQSGLYGDNLFTTTVARSEVAHPVMYDVPEPGFDL
jgi:hypothetical protein